jgi:hypothetical protein
MDTLRLGKVVRRIIMLKLGSSGALEATILYEDPRKKKKQTRALRPIERATRRLLKAQRVYWDSLADRHDLSNQKKRDGWARDGISNFAKASRKGARELIKGL